MRRTPGGSRWDLLATPGLKRLLFINWLLSASWDVHSFAVPVLGHARGYSASTIGLVLGIFTAAVTAVRFAIPLLAHRLHHLTPAHRHGEAIAFRSMAINFSSSVMPLAFGLLGTALGPGVLFWLMGAAVGGGSWAAKGLQRVLGAEPSAG